MDERTVTDASCPSISWRLLGRRGSGGEGGERTDSRGRRRPAASRNRRVLEVEATDERMFNRGLAGGGD
jgi:hypothetical protein